MSPRITERARQVLRRFPAHLDVERPGKQFAHVVDGLTRDLDRLAADTGGVRNAHRLDYAPTLRDLAAIGSLHRIDGDDLGLTTLRMERLGALVEALRAAIDGGTDAAPAAAELLDALGVPAVLDRLAPFAPATADGGGADPVAAARALLDGARRLTSFDAAIEATRRRIGDICALHGAGNGTVRALLRAVLSALDLEADRDANAAALAQLTADGRVEALDLTIGDEFFHSADHFWHSTFVRNSVELAVVVAAPAPAKVVRMGAEVTAAVLAQRMQLPVARVLDGLRAGGLADAGPRTTIAFDAADRLAAAEGFEVERVRRGTIDVGDATTARDLGRMLGVPAAQVESSLARLTSAPPPAGTPLTPQHCALVGRKYGYRVQYLPPRRVEALGIEENPVKRETKPAQACQHGSCFSVRRRGFGRQRLRVRIDGVGDGTMGPMLVNRDEGRGIGLFGPVPEGSHVLFTEEGRAILDGNDVTANAFAWHGACFADNTVDRRNFVFAGPGADPRRVARFVEAMPPGSLDREARYPHATESLDVPGIGLGETRFAFFVQQAHVGHRPPTGTAVTPTPHGVVAFANASVFALGPDPRAAAGPTDGEPVAGSVTLSWVEHEGYAVRVIVPSRLRYLATGDTGLGERIQRAVERVRPAGVVVRVDFVDERWILGQGTTLDDPQHDNPNDLLRGSTTLWSATDDT